MKITTLKNWKVTNATTTLNANQQTQIKGGSPVWIGGSILGTTSI